MAVSFPLSFPSTTGIKSFQLRQRSIVGRSTSTFTGEQQIQVHQGQFWLADVALPPLTRAQAADWWAFVCKLNGGEGTFTMTPPNHGTARGDAGGTPLVNGASQTGGSLITDGWDAGVTNILRAGDFFQLGSGSSTRLYMNLNDVNSDACGNATLDIWPDLRSSPANNDPLTVSNPKGLWRMATNVNAMDWDAAKIYGIAFSIIEAL